MAIEKSVRDAFLANMCDKSVIDVQGQFVKGIPVYEKRIADTSGKLIWAPTFGAIAASGDLGYTTGPWIYRMAGKDVAFGNFATVWQKQPDGHWKFLIDLGNSYDPPEEEQDTMQLIEPDKNIASLKATTDLMAVDESFADAMNKGSTALYKKYLHPGAHILRAHMKPFVTAASKEVLELKRQHIIFQPQQSYTASSNDLGVVYGVCQMVPVSNEKTVSSSVYMHVWRRDRQEGWQLLHETIK